MAIRRVLLLLSASMLVVLGCGDDDAAETAAAAADAETSAEATVVTSDDGVLTVTVPPGAGPSDVTIATGEDPREAIEAGAESLGTYELGPDGATFSEPVLLEWRTELTSEESEVPLVTGVISAESGDGFEPLDDLVVLVEDGSVVVQATTTHFSTAAVYRVDVGNGHLNLRLEPGSFEAQVGVTQEVEAIVDCDDCGELERWVFGTGTRVRDPNADGGISYAEPETNVLSWQLRSDENAERRTYNVTCEEEGEGRYVLIVPYRYHHLAVIATNTSYASASVAGTATCTARDGGGGDEGGVAIGDSRTCHARGDAGGNSDQDVEVLVDDVPDGTVVSLIYVGPDELPRNSTAVEVRDGRAVVKVPLQAPGEELSLVGAYVDGEYIPAEIVGGDHNIRVTPLDVSDCELGDQFAG